MENKTFAIICIITEIWIRADKGRLALRVKDETGTSVKLWFRCTTEPECTRLIVELDSSEYWRFVCHSNGEIVERKHVSSLAYKCTIL